MDETLSRALAWLDGHRNADGGWGYRPGQTSCVEPTAVAALAFHAAGQAPRDAGLRWLLAAQRSDGEWGLGPAGDKPSWMSAWAVWALAVAGSAPEPVDRGAGWLLAMPTLAVTAKDDQDRVRRLLEINPELRGWPWQAGEASWVFPTALCVLALTAAGRQGAPRMDEAMRYLDDRVCPAGGWNFGNPTMLGRSLPPTIPETAIALLAMRARDVPPARASVSDGLRFLVDGLPAAQSAVELAWGIMAATAWGRGTSAFVGALSSSQTAGGDWEGRVLATGLAVLAIAGLRLPAAEQGPSSGVAAAGVRAARAEAGPNR